MSKYSPENGERHLILKESAFKRNVSSRKKNIVENLFHRCPEEDLNQIALKMYLHNL